MSTGTIINCFKKAGISSEAQCTAITDADDPFKDLKESLDELNAADPEPDMVPEGLSVESVVDVDNDVITTAPIITEDDILEQFTKQQPGSDEDNDDEEESLADVAPERPSRSEVESALDVLKNAALYSSTGEEMTGVLLKFENMFTKERIKSAKQMDISVYFKRI